MNLPAIALSLALAVPSVPLTAGQPAPFAGELSDAPTVAAVVARVRGCEAERQALRAALQERGPDLGPVVLVGLVALVAGVAAGFWAARR